MEVDYFTNLPPEITTDILSRLSIKSLAITRCVCKAWRDLFDFFKSKIKTPPVFVCLTSKYGMHSTRCRIFEIEDEDEDDLECRDLDCHLLTDFEIRGLFEYVRGIRKGITANGLLLIYSTSENPLYICNLITREYTELCYPVGPDHEMQFGFGVSKISEQYKVICINSFPKSDPHYVYTLGAGTWRHLEAGTASGFEFHSVGCIVCNGNLHWIVVDSSHIKWICSLDIETERFSIFTLPNAGIGKGELCVLRDCLCYSYTRRYEIVIWMMKEYQVDESWTMEYKLNTFDLRIDWHYISVEVIKIFKDSDILFLRDEDSLCHYSNKTKTLQQVDMFEDAYEIGRSLVFTPSFFSLKNFGFENVILF